MRLGDRRPFVFMRAARLQVTAGETSWREVFHNDDQEFLAPVFSRKANLSRAGVVFGNAIALARRLTTLLAIGIIP